VLLLSLAGFFRFPSVEGGAVLCVRVVDVVPKFRKNGICVFSRTGCFRLESVGCGMRGVVVEKKFELRRVFLQFSHYSVKRQWFDFTLFV
jgi:hypothetical protein